MPGRTNKAKQDDDGRMAARNRLAAIKNAMKERLKQEECAQVAAMEMPKEVEKIVFDAGFFRIESPVKSFSGLCFCRDLREIFEPNEGLYKKVTIFM